MAVSIIGPKFYGFGSDGKPLAFGKLYTYQARTNDPKDTYQSEDQIVPNSNPVILNGEGYANVYLSGSYKMVLKDKDENEIWSSDPVSASQPDEWVNCLSATYLSSTSFKVNGNFVSEYEPGRRVRIDNNASEYAYSTIDTSVFAGGETTIVITDAVILVGVVGVCSSIIGLDSTSGQLINDLSQVYDFTTVAAMQSSMIAFPIGKKLSTGLGLWLVVDVATSTSLATGNYAKLLNRVGANDFGADSTGLTPSTSAVNDMVLSGYPYVFSGGTYLLGDITLTGNAFIYNAILKADVGSTITVNAKLTAPPALVFDTSIGDVVFNDTYSIEPKWFEESYVGLSQTIRGRNASQAAIGKPLLINYNHIDGYRAAEAMTSGVDSAAVGTFAAAGCLTMEFNTFFGYSAGRGLESSGGVFREWSGSHNTGMGTGALNNASSSFHNTAIGSGSQRNVETPQHNTTIGSSCMRLGTEHEFNSCFGSQAAYNLGKTGVEADNSDNAIFGYFAATLWETGKNNSIFGSKCGQNPLGGDNNSWFGFNAGGSSSSIINGAICFGFNAQTSASDVIQIGSNRTESVAGRTHIGQSGTTSCKILGVYNQTNASAANVYVASDSQLYRSTSSLKYKEVIESVSLDWALKTLDFEPILYKPKDNSEDESWTYYGYGAEQVLEVDPRYVHMVKEPTGQIDKNGDQVLSDEYTPNGVMYDRIVVAQGLIIKDLLSRIEHLESKNI